MIVVIILVLLILATRIPLNVRVLYGEIIENK